MIVTPDGVRYLSDRPPSPFHLRWLVPAVCGRSEARWEWCCRISTVAAAAGVGVLAGGRWERQVAAALLFAGLPAVEFAWRRPVLVDMPTVAVAVWCANAGVWWLTVALAVVAGAVSERGPVWAALFAWSPVPLIGLAVVAARALVHRPGPDPLDGTEAAWACLHPLQAGRKFHAGHWRDPLLMVAPWGGCCAALLCGDWRVGAVAGVGYAQLALATDTVRLYQQAAPAVVAGAVTCTPPVVWPALIVATWFNPWRGSGV